MTARVGQRVQLPVWSDTWMRGDRYGTVVLVGTVGGRTLVKIRGDKGTLARLWADDCEIVGGAQ